MLKLTLKSQQIVKIKVSFFCSNTYKSVRCSAHMVTQEPRLMEVTPSGHISTAEWKGDRTISSESPKPRMDLIPLQLIDHQLKLVTVPLFVQEVCSSLCAKIGREPDIDKNQKGQYTQITTVYIKVLCLEKSEVNRKV